MRIPNNRPIKVSNLKHKTIISSNVNDRLFIRIFSVDWLWQTKQKNIFFNEISNTEIFSP